MVSFYTYADLLQFQWRKRTDITVTGGRILGIAHYVLREMYIKIVSYGGELIDHISNELNCTGARDVGLKSMGAVVAHPASNPSQNASSKSSAWSGSVIFDGDMSSIRFSRVLPTMSSLNIFSI
jgi:hypothetical protein